MLKHKGKDKHTTKGPGEAGVLSTASPCVCRSSETASCVLSIAMFKVSLKTYSRVMSALTFSPLTKNQSAFRRVETVWLRAHACTPAKVKAFTIKCHTVPSISAESFFRWRAMRFSAELDRLNFNQCCDRGARTLSFDWQVVS